MSSTYDVVMVGGGLAGAGLGRLLARAGLRVLVLERTLEFRDRVRGEVLVPWGVAEAKRLGFEELLRPVGNDLRGGNSASAAWAVARVAFPRTCRRGGGAPPS